jgi:hypothetical protein
MSRRSWNGNREVHFWWESPFTCALLLLVMAFVAAVI